MARNHLLLTSFLTIAVLLAPVEAAGRRAAETRSVTDRYLELTFSQRYDDLRALYAPNAVFHDPTAEVFEGPVAQGPVEGAEAIIKMQKGRGLDETVLEQRAAFSVGAYSLYRGTLTTRFRDSDVRTPIPWVTVLRVDDGLITERTDFAEYIESFKMGDRFDAETARTKDIAWRYLRAYFDGDLATQEALLATDVLFQDPTAQVYGPGSGKLFRSAADILARRRQLYTNVSDFDLEVEESFAANHHAVTMGTVRYRVGGRAYAQPAVMVVEVRDGRVTRHWDFVDYSVN